MKKLFALLLCVALLVPMCLVANADGEVSAEPFYMLNCSSVNNLKFPYIEEYVNARFSNLGDKVRITYGGATLTYGSYTDADVTKFAEAIKKVMDRRPEGMRWIHAWGPRNALGLVAEHSVYLDFGAKQMKDLITAFLKKYKEIGGQLDGMLADTEYVGLGSWYVQGDSNKDPLLYKKIVDDPRYATEIRPLLVERGFKFYHNVTDLTPEIYGIHKGTGDAYQVSRDVWDTVMSIRLAKYLNDWCLEPLLTYYPDATLSDYQKADTYAWLKGVNDAGSVVGSVAGNTMKAGNVSNYNFYASRPGTKFYQETSGAKIFKFPPTYMGAIYEATPYNMFQWDANLAKRIYTSDEFNRISVWLAQYNYSKQKGTLDNTPYYSEQILHLGMLDPEPILGYLYDQGIKDADGKVSPEAYEKCLGVVNELLAELTRVAGYSDRKPIEIPMTWNREFVLSGMYANGRNIWRITPNTDVVSVADFKVEGADPTFYVAGQKITFPGGKIIEDATISVVGTCGYWVETAKDVTPIVTNDADRLEKLPAYLEDFESYALGTKLTAMVVRDENGWIIQPKGSDLLVEADGENKVLSITGDSLMQSKQIPANVTIADSYAAEQVWEITVTVPAGMTAEESLVLMNYTASKTPAKDGGYKISGGKISYSDNGTYKELPLDVSAGGKFTLKRVLNFDKNTCDYIVLGADGKEVASAKGVTIPSFTGKIATIDITCSKMKGRAQLDNFALRAAGVGADFGMYDAKTGLRVSPDKANPGSTAYRFSWTNINGGEKTATVMADIYEGETLKETKTIKEVKMGQGCDDVAYGVVEAAEGQSVKIYVKTDVKVVVDPGLNGKTAEPTTPTQPGTTNPTTGNSEPTTTPTAAPTEAAPTTPATTEKDGGMNIGLIVVIAAVAVAVIGLVLVLVLTKKKKK